MEISYGVALWVAILIGSVSSQLSTFNNPVYVLSTTHRNSVHRLGGFYYMMITYDRSIDILKSAYLTSFRYAERKTIYTVPTGYDQAVRCHMMELDGDLYLYFSMRNNSTLGTMYAMKARDPENPLGYWNAPIRILEHIWTSRATHGNVLKHNNKLYFLWSDTGNLEVVDTYIAQMESPTRIIEPFVKITAAADPWECIDYCINEAPAFIYNRGVTYMVLTAGNALSPDSCLTYMSIGMNEDPMNISSWTRAPGCVFERNDEDNVYAPTQATFTTSPDGTETWMMYHAHDSTTNIVDRQARIDKIEWDVRDGKPVFPKPHGFDRSQKRPSGEPDMFLNPILDEDTRNVGILKLENEYYMITSNFGNARKDILIYESENLANFRDSNVAVAHSVSGTSAVNSGRMFNINGELYLYSSIVVGSKYQTYQMKAVNSSNPMESWSTPVLLLNEIWNFNSAHGYVMEHNSNTYFIWSGNIPPATTWEIYMAQMLSPLEIVGPVVLLKKPNEPWECQNGCVTYIASTVNRIDSSNSCVMSYMSIETSRDPLDVSSWVTADGPAFTENPDENVKSPSHGALTTSPDGKETWMVYHVPIDAQKYSLRLEKVMWDTKFGHPIFPKAHGYNHPQPVPSAQETFSNPISSDNVCDTSIFQLGAFYYLTLSENDGSAIAILKSRKLNDFNDSDRMTVYTAPDGHGDIVGSELHEIKGQLYIYFTMKNETHGHRIYAIQADIPSDPMAGWSSETKIFDHIWDTSLFPTILKHKDKLYIAWTSLHPITNHYGIYLAEMESPVAVSVTVLLLTEPVEEWECGGGCASGAPYFIHENGTSYMIYNVGTPCDPGYGLTYMSIENEKNPMQFSNWFKASGPVFGSNPDENVHCTGHTSFTKSPDGKETWMLYHASDIFNSTDAARNPRIERISWSADRSPNFPKAHGYGSAQVIPARPKFD